MRRFIVAMALAVAACLAAAPTPAGQVAKHAFTLGTNDFLLDGKPLQAIGCEMHPARIPAEYWAHRIKMAKALGCNTIAAYLFWNYHETAEGTFDFTTGNRDIARFIRLVQAEGMWVLLRPGPYVCAEWDFGGIPIYLLRIPDIKVRCLNPQYMKAAERYIQRLAAVIRPLLVTNGGPILLVQVENEYGSYDHANVFVDGKLIGTLDRRLGEKSIDLPKTDNPMPVLDILVEGMGHINFAQEMIDRKGITDRVTLSGMTLMNWDVFLLPLADSWVTALPAGPADPTRPGVFFRGSFTIDTPADTFIDMTGYRKGVVWVNGHNLGRYWDIGPQKRLFCPAPWLKPGANDVVVFDLHKLDASPLRGAPTLE